MSVDPWTLVVVRAWQDEDGLVVRMTLSDPTLAPVICYETSPAAAGRRLTDWLVSSSAVADGAPAPERAPAGDESADAGADGAATGERHQDP